MNAMNADISTYLSQIKLPAEDSHKGQNGKLLIIGGSELFHAASKWSLDVASKFVDMVFYSSVPTNNELVKTAKGEFWNGIVVQREDLESYLEEADCILIGPGMTRESETEKITNSLVKKYAHKKWVIDAGALQMIDPKLLNQNMIVTPHIQEFIGLYRRMARSYLEQTKDGYKIEIGGETTEYSVDQNKKIKENEDYPLLFEKEILGGLENLQKFPRTRDYLLQASKGLNRAVILLKGQQDFVFQYHGYDRSPFLEIQGGNAGMTKGGTGDVLAGLVAALYCTHDVFTSAVVGSYINKRAGDALHEKVGPYFNASNLVNEIPTVFWSALKEVHAKRKN